MLLRPAIFLDRDGTIIEDRNYLGDPEGVRLLAGAAEAIRLFNGGGWPVVIVSNQSGIGRGLISADDYERVKARMEMLLAHAGAHITATYHCPHSPDASLPCDCRKPLPGMFLSAARDHALDLSRSHYAGDRMRDIEPGLRLGGTGYLLVPAPSRAELPAGVIPIRDLLEMAELVLNADCRQDVEKA